MPVTDPVEERLYGTLLRYTSEPTARGILRRARQHRNGPSQDAAAYFDMIMFGAKLFVEEPRRAQLVAELSTVCYGNAPQSSGSHFEVTLTDEHSTRRARMLVRQLVRKAGGRDLIAVRAATALSELARNALVYAGGGMVEIDVGHNPDTLRVRVSDSGPGIHNLDEIFAGQYRSKTGLGRGLAGVKKLANHFRIDTGTGGTTVEFEMRL